MKKALFCVLALAMPFILSAQVDVVTYSPYQNGPYNVRMHGHVVEIDDLAATDSVAVKCYYRISGADSWMETGTVVATRDHGIHFEIPAFGLIPGEDYECQFSATVNENPELFGGTAYFTPSIDFDDVEVETSFAEHVGNNHATLVGFVEEFGSYETANGYFRYGENPTALDLVTPVISVVDPFGQFEIDIKGLNAGKIINFQACATTPLGESCGDIIHFLTPNKGNIDVEYLDIYEDDCMVTFEFSVDMGDRPTPAPATFRIGNAGGETYTKEFWYQGWGSAGLTFDYATLIALGVDPDAPVIMTFTISSYGETGKTGGTVILDNDCDEFAGEGDGFRIADNIIRIYPNPAVESIFVKNVSEKANVQIADMSGKIIGKYSLDVGTTEISVATLERGVYFVTYSGEGNTITKKIVVQ